MNIVAEEGMELIQKRVEQAIALIQRLKEENQNLILEINRLQDEIQKLKQEANQMRAERVAIKEKINTAASMLDKVDLEDMLERLAEEVTEESKNNKKHTDGN
jgi:FtsZ-binding cell division protein ZapB